MKELYPGDQGTMVMYLQLALKRAGRQLAIDGIFGPSSVKSWQKYLNTFK